MWLVIQQQFARVQLGGAGRVVVITFFTKKKTNAGGFVGRNTAGHKTIVMGFLELDLATRKATHNPQLALYGERKPVCSTGSESLRRASREAKAPGLRDFRGSESPRSGGTS